jgi:hypothetical protein
MRYLAKNKLSTLTALIFVVVTFFTFSYNTNAQIITTDQTWTASSTQYIINNLTIQDGATLIIKEGVVIKFDNQNSYIEVKGRLNIDGTNANKVYFTFIKDDTIAGDTNNDGSATSPAPGDWSNTRVLSGGVLNINHADLSYGSY